MRKATIVVDLGYGDAGKGSVTDWLSRHSPLPTVIRTHGGSQCGHNVHTDKIHHCFAQLGSGTLAGAATHLAEHMLVNPIHLFAEAKALADYHPLQRLTVSPHVKLVTPWHKAVNRARERASGPLRHGTCAHGIGETMRLHEAAPDLTLHLRGYSAIDVLEMRDALHEELCWIEKVVGRDLDEHHVFSDPDVLYSFRAAARDLQSFMAEDDLVMGRDCDFIFEGAQGVLLDERYGFHPFTTWSNCTTDKAMDMLCAWSDIEVTTLGIIRAFPTRHGPGPFPTELTEPIVDLDNVTNEWQGPWRTGLPDLVTLRYAIDACGGIDLLGVTCVDQGTPEKVCMAYFMNGEYHETLKAGSDLDEQLLLTTWVKSAEPIYRDLRTVDFPRWLADALDVPLGMVSEGPSAAQKRGFSPRLTRRGGSGAPAHRNASMARPSA